MPENIEQRVVILEASDIEDWVDHGGFLYELKKMNIIDGVDYQIDNGGDLLMDYPAYVKCRKILRQFKVKVFHH
jgi:hypothetical protein